MSKPLTVSSNILNEIEQLENGWLDNMIEIADGGILIVDGGSTDGTLEYLAKEGAKIVLGEHRNASDFAKYVNQKEPTFFTVVIDDIIQREGYGPARNHLRQCTREFQKDSFWMAYFDADERINREDYHILRHLKDSLLPVYDAIAFPRIDWKPDGTMAKDWKVQPDFQARMTRLDSPVQYVRRLHEQLTGFRQIYMELTNPKINHYHRCTSQEKRDYVGMVCAYLHEKDEMGNTYPEHHKEAHYRKMLEEKGL